MGGGWVFLGLLISTAFHPEAQIHKQYTTNLGFVKKKIEATYEGSNG
jgi:hypothetical protein